MVLFVSDTEDQAGGVGAVDQLYDAVVAKKQVVGDLPDSGAARIVMATNREQELMLRGCQAGGSGLLLAPVQKATQTGAQRQQASIVNTTRTHSQYDTIVTRCL